MKSPGVLLDAQQEAGAVGLQKDSLSLAFTTRLLDGYAIPVNSVRRYTARLGRRRCN